MLRGYRSAVLAAGLILLASALQAQELPGPALEGEPVPAPQEREGAAAGEDNRARDRDRTLEIAPVLERIEGAIRDLKADVSDEDRQWQNQREIRDLNAQEEMAFWAKLMFIATAVTVIITFIALVAIIKTLHHTRRAADYAGDMAGEAKKTTEAAIDSAKEARAANEIAAERAKRQFDPYLFISMAKYRPLKIGDPGKEEVEYIAAITIKNGSNWPAFVKENTSQTFFFVDRRFAGGGSGHGFGGTRELKPGETLPFEFGAQHRDLDPSKDIQVIHGVRVAYDTLEGRRKFKEFWFRRENPRAAPANWVLQETTKPDLIGDGLPDVYRALWGSGDG